MPHRRNSTMGLRPSCTEGAKGLVFENPRVEWVSVVDTLEDVRGPTSGNDGRGIQKFFWEPRIHKRTTVICLVGITEVHENAE